MKKGQYHYGIILNLILAVLVMTIALFFIFNEGILDKDGDREVCWQSVQLRAAMPEDQKLGFNIDSKALFEDQFPLKCKTRVVEISESDVSDIKGVQKEIADAMAECWALYGSGDYDVFPSNIFKVSSACVPCARIHLTDDAKKALAGKKISIKDALNSDMDQGFSYYSYLKDSGDKFPAFSPASALEFDIGGGKFEVDASAGVPAVFKNRLGGVDKGMVIGGVYSAIDISKVSLPEFLDPEKGDLMINYGAMFSTTTGNIGNYIPYLFYFQTGQDPNPFKEVKKILVDGALWKNANVCGSWEGVPA